MRKLTSIAALAISPLYVSAGVATADPLPVADVAQSAVTDDGWHLSASLTRMTINAVPNMAATAFTREGFVTGKAAASIDGNGAIPVNTGSLVMGCSWAARSTSARAAASTSAPTRASALVSPAAAICSPWWDPTRS